MEDRTKTFMKVLGLVIAVGFAIVGIYSTIVFFNDLNSWRKQTDNAINSHNQTIGNIVKYLNTQIANQKK